MRAPSFLALSLVGALAWTGCTSTQGAPQVLPAPGGPVTQVGSSKIHRTPPNNRLIAVNGEGKRTAPRIEQSARGGVTSNDWWSSLIYAQDDKSVESLPLYAHPLVLQTHAGGFGVSYPNKPKVLEREYMYRHDEDFIVGLEGFEAESLVVTGHSDFDVEVELRGGAGALKGVLGHGLPYLQLTRPEGASNVVIRFTKGKGVRPRRLSKSTAIFRSGSRIYAAFAPSGTWEEMDGGLSSDLGGRRHFAIAALPNSEPETIELFRQHAFAFVRSTAVTWSRDGGVLLSKYRAETQIVEPCDAQENNCARAEEALLALYPHQWNNSSSPMIPGARYASPRGQMKLSASGEFITQLTVQGLLPLLPIAPKERSKLSGWLIQETDGQLFPLGLGENPDHDAYWDGKSLGRVSTMAQIAHSLGKEELRDRLIDALKVRLTDWFDGEAPRYFYYDKEWRSLMAFPDSYGSASHLNDHHFHYGYFIHAAATVAFFDPDWAKANMKMVEMLIRDVASPDRDDPLFPRLRHMDPYAGHSWANGPAQFFEGNNEESSSEDMNFSYSLALWGALTGNQQLEDLGLYLYSTQTSAVEEYWFDTNNHVFPESFDHPTVAMVWGAGGKYDTWFDQDPGIIHGINFLPFSGGSLYLGRHPEYVRKNFQTIVERSYGEITTWRDPILMFAALGDPEDALRRYEKDALFQPEFGASQTMTRLWLTSLAHYGLPRFSPSPRSPYEITFETKEKKTRVAFDPQTRKTTIN